MTLFSAAGLALKLVRYQKDDPHDVAAILRLGRAETGVQWTPDGLEQWLRVQCWPMGYDAYSAWQLDAFRHVVRHAVRLAEVPAA